ncbi:MAG: hypothetical protein OES32_12980 [Acidobacteriota bacterium]|nr:hypothetical protein [Acidobacteriota bacterium]MDH3524492.1 hypothetical protein [Acidobacteriota bacterium]
MRVRLLWITVCVLLVAMPGLAQDRMSDASASGVPIGRPESQIVTQVGGPITFWGDRPSFDAAFPGLPCEDWQDFSNVLLGCDAPANNGTSCPGGYNAGDILAGLEIDCTQNSGPGLGGLVIVPAGFDGNPSITFGSNFFVDNTIVNLNPAVEAIGLDIQCHFGSPSVNVDVFDGGGVLVASTASACANAGTFLGISSNAPGGVGSIVINDPSGVSVETTDDVCFGGDPVPVTLQSIDVN